MRWLAARTLATVMKTRRPIALEERSHDRQSYMQATPVLDPDGNVSAIAVLSFDITERKRMEEQLRDSVAALEQALQRGEDPQWAAADLCRLQKDPRRPGLLARGGAVPPATHPRRVLPRSLPRLHSPALPDTPARSPRALRRRPGGETNAVRS